MVRRTRVKGARSKYNFKTGYEEIKKANKSKAMAK